ncbi:hypothetical protein WJX73_003966 [Symbiochloris irregularis]|uniref:Uncharacterized protein n=1 Tax=Symbiochloris irregularis TaxID=706552 RepID=A0AAW1NN38_9CHLO
MGQQLSQLVPGWRPPTNLGSAFARWWGKYDPQIGMVRVALELDRLDLLGLLEHEEETLLNGFCQRFKSAVTDRKSLVKGATLMASASGVAGHWSHAASQQVRTV